MAQIKTKCTNCGIEVLRYPSQCLKTVYCSRECRSKYFQEKHTVLFKCDFCGMQKRIRKANYKTEGNHFCSRICKDKWQRIGLKGSSNPFFQKVHSEKSKKKIREKKYGKFTGLDSPNYNTHQVNCAYCGKIVLKIGYLLNRSKRLFCSIECHGKWKSENLRGENSPSWNHDLSEEERISKRKYPEYYEFISGVMKRDSYTCDLCGKQGKWGDGLNAHHLNSYDWDKQNRTNIDNGITLCKKCHMDFHKKYGYGKNTKEQYSKFKESI